MDSPDSLDMREKMQLDRLRDMMRSVLATNRFYRKKFAGFVPDQLTSTTDLRTLPFTSKNELLEDQLSHQPFGSNLTDPLERYIRIHQTSGTTGKPLYWLDTEESWNWWADCWKVVFAAADVSSRDRIYFAFSFGPFIGFWAGWEGARKLGTLAISGGAQSTAQRIQSIIDSSATVLVCTPTYALHMASEAKKAGIDLARDSAIRTTIHAGEPGASIPSIKKLIEESWGAKCFDHAGATEVGAFAFQCASQTGAIHINEIEFIAEVIDPLTGAATKDGEQGELVMTNLGRVGSPVIRYRTGDLVAPSRDACPCGRAFLLLLGGVLGRVDDMVIVRGVNVFPSAVENIIREFSEIEEFRVEICERQALREMKLVIEPKSADHSIKTLGEQVSRRIRERIGLRPEIELVSPGTLPRFELKAKRFFKLKSE
jgi:phenylacetate-CoA ligase